MKLQIHNHYQTIKAVYGLLNSKNKDDHEVGYDLLIKFINDLRIESEGYNSAKPNVQFGKAECTSDTSRIVHPTDAGLYSIK